MPLCSPEASRGPEWACINRLPRLLQAHALSCASLGLRKGLRACAERQSSVAAQKEVARAAAAAREESHRYEHQEASLKRELESK